MPRQYYDRQTGQVVIQYDDGSEERVERDVFTPDALAEMQTYDTRDQRPPEGIVERSENVRERIRAPIQPPPPTPTPQPPFDRRSPFEQDVGEFFSLLPRTAIESIPGGFAATLPFQLAGTDYFKRREPPAATPPAEQVEETYPIPPEPTIGEALEEEGFPTRPPDVRRLSAEDLPPIPLIEEGALSIDPAIARRAELARGREQRFSDLTAGRRGRIEEQLQRYEDMPRWTRALHILGAGLSGLNSGQSVQRATEAYGFIPEQVNRLESQLLELGLSQEDLIQAREEAELAPASAQHQLDTQRILSNHQVAVQEAIEARRMAIDANQTGNERDFQVWSQRLQIALEKLKQNMANVHRAAGVQQALGGAPMAESVLGQVAPLGPEAQQQAADRLARANLQGLIESDIAISGGNEGRAVSLMRRRVQQMFARAGLPAPAVNKRVMSNPSTFAEYLIRASNGRILQDPEVRRFEYLPGIAAEQ